MMRPIRSLLFSPGNNPGMIQNADIYGADAIIFDLEDAVAPGEKDAARLLVAEALAALDFGDCEIVVRINSLDGGGREDIAAIVPLRPVIVMLPKVQSVEEVAAASRAIAAVEGTSGTSNTTRIVVQIETPLGILRSFTLAAADERIIALALGAEDYTATLGVARSRDGREIEFARAMIANAANAAGIAAWDTPFTGVSDDAGLRTDTLCAKSLGLGGKLCIHPSQVEVVNDVYRPTPEEVAWAREVVEAFEAAAIAGTGAVSVRGKMIDAPVEIRARATLLAARFGRQFQGVPSC